MKTITNKSECENGAVFVHHNRPNPEERSLLDAPCGCVIDRSNAVIFNIPTGECTPTTNCLPRSQVGNYECICVKEGIIYLLEI